MYVIVLIDGDRPNLSTSRCKGPFDTEAEARKQLEEYFAADLLYVSAFVIEVKKPGR